MNIVRCEEGHFYDSETYSLCPHCGKGPVKENKKNTRNVRTPRNTMSSLFHKRENNSRGEVVSDTFGYMDVDQKTEALHNDFNSNKQNYGGSKKDADLKTYDFWDSNTFDDQNIENEMEYQKNVIKSDIKDLIADDRRKKYKDEEKVNAEDERNNFPEEKNTYADDRKIYREEEFSDRDNTYAGKEEKFTNDTDEEKDEVSTKKESVKEALRSVSASEEGKTFGYFSLNKKDNKTEKDGNLGIEEEIEPVVGWLVCTKGPLYGKCFNIYAGRNSIGRGNGNKIIIKGDNYISRDKHVYVIYEPRKREFRVQPGISEGLTYFNGDEIYETTSMKKGDEIEIGKTTLRLIPLCGEDFSWEV